MTDALKTQKMPAAVNGAFPAEPKLAQGEKAIRVDLPGEFRGWIVVPTHISAEEYFTYYEQVPRSEEERQADTRHAYFREYERMRPLVRAFHVEGVKEADTRGDGRHMPNMALVTLVVQAIDELFDEANNPKVLPGQS